MLAFIGGVGMQELIIIFLIVLLLFGGKKIPEIARGLGKAMREFRKAQNDIRDTLENDDEDKEKDETKGTKNTAADPKKDD